MLNAPDGLATMLPCDDDADADVDADVDAATAMLWSKSASICRSAVLLRP